MEYLPEIIIGVLSCAGTLIGSLAGIRKANELTNYRVLQLEKKVEKHNGLMDKTYQLQMWRYWKTGRVYQSTGSQIWSRKEHKMKKITADTIARTIVLGLALVNQVLAIAGKEVLPFADDDIYQLVSLIATIAASAAAWWKNNSFTAAAIEADAYKERIKEGGTHEDLS